MKLLSVPELAGLAWNTPVQAVAGVIQMVHPKMGGNTGWSLQNGRLEDTSGRVVVEFMLSKHERYWEPERVRGKRVEFHAVRPDDLVWKEQKPKPNVNRGRAFAKLEVAATARIVFPDEVQSLPGLGEPAGAPATALPLPLPETPRLDVPVARPSEKLPLRAQLRQMIGLHAEVQKVVAAEAPPEAQAVLTERLFAQACAAGMFRAIDPDSPPGEDLPSRPNLARLADLARGRDEMLNLLLRGVGAIRMDETWQALSEEAAAKVLARGDLLALFERKAG